MHPRNLGIDFPLFAFSHCRDVVAAVTNAGGFGVLGATAYTPEQLDRELAWIDDHVFGRPYGADIIVPAKFEGKGENLSDGQLADRIPADYREFVAQLLIDHGLLWGMDVNDNYRGWDDDMMVGSVHSVCFIETLYWLDRCGYDGWYSMDQYPYREDAVGAISESILWLAQFDAILQAQRGELDCLVAQGDAVATSRFLRSVLARG